MRKESASTFRYLVRLNALYGKRVIVIVLGLVLLLVGVFAGIIILKTIGLILLIVGVVLLLLGSMGQAVGGRRHYW